jgi:hypothetical protein
VYSRRVDGQIANRRRAIGLLITTVEATDHQARVLTLKDASGEMVTVDVPAAKK